MHCCRLLSSTEHRHAKTKLKLAFALVEIISIYQQLLLEAFPLQSFFAQCSALMLKWNDCIPLALLSRIIGNYLFLTYAGNLEKHNSNSVTSDELLLQNSTLQCSSPVPISLVVLIQISEVLCAEHCFLSTSSTPEKFFCCVTLNPVPTFFEIPATLDWLKRKQNWFYLVPLYFHGWHFMYKVY